MEGSQGGGAGGGDGAQDRAIVFANDVMHWQDKVAYRLAPEEKAAQLELVTSLGHRREELVASAAALFGYLLSGRMGSARRRIQAGILCGAWSYSTAYLALDNDPGYRYLTKVSACDTRLGAYVRGLLSDNRVQQPPDLADRITPLTVVSVLTLAHFVTLFVSFSVKKVEATVSKDAGNFSAAVPLLSMYSVTLKLRAIATLESRHTYSESLFPAPARLYPWRLMPALLAPASPGVSPLLRPRKQALRQKGCAARDPGAAGQRKKRVLRLTKPRTGRVSGVLPPDAL
eukprot:gene14149-21678_t